MLSFEPTNIKVNIYEVLHSTAERWWELLQLTHIVWIWHGRSEAVRVHSPDQTELCIYTSEIWAGGGKTSAPAASIPLHSNMPRSLKTAFILP